MATGCKRGAVLVGTVAWLALAPAANAQSATDPPWWNDARPRGPHPVGVFRDVWYDSTRTPMPMLGGTGLRGLGIQIYFPIDSRSSGVAAPYLPSTRILLAPGADFSETETRLFPTLASHARSSRWPQPGSEPAPVILFSPGLGVPAFAYTVLLEEFASWGYTVVAIDHPYTGVVDLGDRVITMTSDSVWGWYRTLHSSVRPGFRHSVVREQASDFAFVLDRLIQRRAVDRTRVIAAGHSFGGSTAIEFCRTDPRPAACVDLDGRLSWSWEVAFQGLDQPFLYLRSDDLGNAASSADSVEVKERIEAERLTYGRFARACDGSLPGSSHMDFSDGGLFRPTRAAADQQAARTALGRIRDFADAVLQFLSTTAVGSAGAGGPGPSSAISVRCQAGG